MVGFSGRPLAERTLSLGRVVVSEHRAGSALGAHTHAVGYVSLCLAGAYREHGPDGTERVGAGGLVVHPPGESHADDFEAEGAHVLSLELDAPARVLFGLEDADAARRVLPLGAEVATQADRALGALGAAEEGGRLFALVESVLERLRREREERAALDPRLAAVRRRLDEAPGVPHALADLAIVAGWHPVHLAQRFKRAFGCSIGEYRRRAMLRLALRAMALERVSVTEAAYAAGFADGAHMTRSFRALALAPPSALRAVDLERDSRRP